MGQRLRFGPHCGSAGSKATKGGGSTRRSTVRGQPSGSDKAQLFLVPFPDDPSQYSVVIKAIVGGASVSWPLGITIKGVTVHPDGALSFMSSALLPNLPSLDVGALATTLRKLGLPDIVTITRAEVTDADPNIKKMAISVSFSIGGLYTDTVSIQLMENGRSVDLDRQIRGMVDRIASALKDQLRKSAADAEVWRHRCCAVCERYRPRSHPR